MENMNEIYYEPYQMERVQSMCQAWTFELM